VYLSRLTLDLSHPSTQRALRDCNDMHRNLMRALPKRDSDALRAEESLLYRLLTVQGRPSLYVTSRSLPDWSLVAGVDLWQGTAPVSFDNLHEKLSLGQKLRFNLITSPTKKERRESKLSARVFLRDENERLDWLKNKADKHGFSILRVVEKEQRHIHGIRQGAQIDYTGIVFDGELAIMDIDAFWIAYTNGIGPGKAYGLGMLMIGRI